MEAKSKAEETEYERLWGFGRGVEPRLELERGSSFERESFLEDEMPDGEEDREV